MKKLNVIILLTLFAAVSCTGQQRGGSPQGYDLNKPVKYFMPESLSEISGIAFNAGKSDIIYAEQDEEGRVYYFRLGDKQVNYTKFAKKGDYEDIAIMGGQVIVLKSNGELFVFPLNQMGKPEAAGVQKQDGLLPSGEYEGLYADERTRQLYVLCKHCGGEKSSKTGGGTILKMGANGVLSSVGQFSINVREIEALAGKKKIQFHPSALAKNMRTNEWYVLSSVNKLLVVADANWKVKATYPLSSSLFIQPEGIAFDNQNNLYISNEGDKVTQGTVFKFIYKK